MFHWLAFIFKFYETPAQDVVCGFLPPVSLLFKACCSCLLPLPDPVMKITLITCLWNTLSGTEYAVTTTNIQSWTLYIQHPDDVISALPSPPPLPLPPLCTISLPISSNLPPPLSPFFPSPLFSPSSSQALNCSKTLFGITVLSRI